MQETSSAADPFLALADPTRRQIVELLQRGELPVNDVVARVDIHQSGVSRHLRILLDAGFVQVRADGQRRLYSLRPEPFVALDGWLAGFRAHWQARLDRFGDALAHRQRAARTDEDAPPRPTRPTRPTRHKKQRRGPQ